MSIIIKNGNGTGYLANVTALGALQTDGSAVTQPVSISGSVPVTGTFWQATQPVSIASPIAVTGTFWQATQPVSAASLPLPSNAAQEAGGNLAIIAGAILSGKVQSNIVGTVATTQLGGSSGLVGDVQAKGVQGVNALMTQDFKDSGRTYVILYADRIAGATTEALATFSINKGGTLSSGTSYVVSAGKTFRIQSVNAEIQNTTTVINRVLVRVRSAASVLVTSPVVAMALAASAAALATSGDTDPHNFPDGIEIAAGQQVGISQLCSVTTAGIVSFTVVGYEY